MTDQFRHILDLVRKTGDTMIVTDPNGEDVFVVMGLEQYEGLKKPQRNLDIWQTMKPAGVQGQTWDLEQMDEKELAELEDQYRQFAQRNVKEAMKSTDEQKKPESEDFGEEAFYLEPVE